jgi:predicted nuclease of restriction endonuclease-like RecB superfamily
MMLAVFKASPGKSALELKEELGLLNNDNDELEKAFEKLLLDRCDWEEPCGDIEALRWEAIMLGEASRSERLFEVCDNYRVSIADTLQMTPESLSETIYSDLPENRKVAKFKDISPEIFLHRYSAAQIQGLLLHARSMTVHLTDLSLGERRTFFRLIKFYQLLSRVTQEGSQSLVVEISGPLDILDQGSRYGMKLANFFPYILQFSRFDLEADIHLKHKTYTLKLDESCGVKSHYDFRESYVPEEFTALMTAIEKKKTNYKLTLCDDFLHIGHESYCFPDFILKDKAGEIQIYLELFHRWHYHQLFHRLDALQKQNFEGLYLGVCITALKKDQLEQLKNHPIFERCGFTFRDFPTAKQILDLSKTIPS